MEEIRFTEEMEQDSWEILAEKKQNVNQYDNLSATLYKDPGSEKIYLYEDMMYEHNLYELEDEDLPENQDYDKLLSQFISAWVLTEDDVALASYEWNLSTPSDDAVKEDYDGYCKVLVVGCYAGYTPINWATDENGKELNFSSAREAQEWIDAADSDGIYYLSDNQQGRSDYYIIAD